jgi:hypothetical protein
MSARLDSVDAPPEKHDRVAPRLGSLARGIEALTRPKRSRRGTSARRATVGAPAATRKLAT